MTPNHCRLTKIITLAALCSSLAACPSVPEREPTWVDNDTWTVEEDISDDAGDVDLDAFIPLVVDRIYANMDEATGGARVSIYGSGFDQGMTVTFGGTEGGYVLALDETRLNVDVPAHEPGLVDVVVERLDGEAVTLTEAFLFRSPLQLTSFEPSEGLITGGHSVTVRGEHFDEETRILVGGRQLIEPLLLDGTTITGRIPSRLKGWHGPVDVVASDGFEQRTLTRAYRYHDSLEVSWMSPSSGSTDGATFVALYGTGMTDETVVRIGGVVTEVFQAGRGDVMIVRTPPGQHGAVDMTLTDPRQSITLRQAFAYVDQGLTGDDEILNAWPATADAGGGTQVALTVMGLPANASAQNVQAEVNGVEATVLEVRPAESLVVISVPEGEPGVAELVLTTDAGTLTSDAAFTYEIGLQVTTFSPGVVAPGVFTPVVFEGLGFDEDTRVMVDGITMTPDAFTDTQLEVLLPPSSPGRADIVITSGDDTLRVPAGVSCRAPVSARILAVSTPDGAQSGGRLGRLFGEGFTSIGGGTPEVSIEGVPVDGIEVVDDAELRFRTPAGEMGAVSVDGHSMGFIAMGYERFDPTVTYGGTSGGALPEALNVTVLDLFTGAPIDLAFVTLWDDLSTPYQGLTDARGQLTLSAAGMGAPQMATASKDQYTTSSIVEFDARNVTLMLIPLTSAPPSPGGGGGGPQELPDGTLGGEVVAIDKYMLPPPGECDPKLGAGSIPAGSDLCQECETDEDCADAGARCVDLGDQGTRCTTACETDDDCPENFMCTGIGGGGIQCIPRPGDKTIWCGTTIPDVFSRDTVPYGDFAAAPATYTFSTTPGEHAIVCLGGFTDPDTEVFKPLLMGVRRHVFAMPGDFVGQQDIVLDIPLNRSIRLRLDDPPTGPGTLNQHRVDIFLDFGPDGLFPMPQQVIGEDVTDVIELPGFPAAFADSLYDASYTIFGAAVTPETLEGLSGTGSYTLHQDISAVHDDAVFEVFEEGARITSTGITHDIRAMDGPGNEWAWAVGDEGKVLAWNGTWWGLQQAPTEATLHGVYARSTVDVWAVGERGAVMHWDGLIWSAVEVPEGLSSVSWWGVDGHADGDVWLLGDQGAWRITDGVWSAVDVGAGVESDALLALWVAGPDEVWFVGKGGLIRRVVGHHPTAMDVFGDHLYAIDGQSEGDVWAVGADGRMLHWDHEVWFDYLPVTQRDLRAVHAAAPDEVWATGDAGAVLNWDGDRWTVHTEVSHVDLRGVLVTSEGRVLSGGMHVLVIGPFLRVPRVVNPTEGGPLNGFELAWSLEEGHDASFTYLQLTESQGFPFWILMVEGKRTTVPLPDLASMWGLQAIWPGSGFMRFVRVYMPTFDIDAHDNTQLTQYLWRSWSTHDIPVFW